MQRRHMVAIHVMAAITLIAIMTYGRFNKSIPDWERNVFDVFNELPRWAGRPLESIMWFGTALGIAVTAGVAAVAGRRRLSIDVLAGGGLTWVLQRAFKPVVDRGRPKELTLDANFWGHLGGAGGIPSGHTAMAVALCTIIGVHVSTRWRIALGVLAALVGIGRMYTGNHFPLDVISGAALGWLGAWVGITAVRRWSTDDERSEA